MRVATPQQASPQPSVAEIATRADRNYSVKDGPATRACMNANGAKLSNRCVNALVSAGEISKAEVTRRTAAATGK